MAIGEPAEDGPRADTLTIAGLQIGPFRPGVAHVAVVALLAVFLSLFFWRLTFEQQVLSPADLVYTAYPWKADAPDNFSPANPYQSDDAYLFYPRRYALYNDTGDSWWQDDYIAGDRNAFFIDSLGLQFYPLAYIYEVMPFHVANSFFHVTVLLAAGLAMYLLLWQLKFPWMAATLGALLYMFNGHFIVWLGHSYLPASLGLVPLMLFGFERYRDVKQPLWLLVPAACIAVEVFLGYVPAWIVSGVILILYGCVRLAPELYARRVRDAAESVVVYTATGLLGLALAMYSLIPSVASAAGSDYQTGRNLGLANFPLEHAWTFLFPDYWGTKYVWFGPLGNFPEAVGYVGISVVPLALLGFWHMRRHWVGWFSIALVVFCAAQLYGIPPLKELAHLPGMKQVGIGRWLFGMNLAVSMIAPAGLMYLLDSKVDAREKRRLAIAVAALVGFAMLAVAVLYLDRNDGRSWDQITEGRALIQAPWDLAANFGATAHRQIAFLLLGAGAAVFALLQPLRARATACGLLVLVFADLFAFGQGYNGTAEKSELYPETPAIEFLQQDDGFFRIAPVNSDGRDQVMPGYTANMFGLRTITGYDHYRNRDYIDFLDPIRSPTDVAIVEQFGYVTVGGQRQALNRNILSLLGVKYIVTGPTGFWQQVGEMPPNETAYPVYGDVTQGMTIDVPSGASAIEFLIATGGGAPPAAPLVLRFRDTVDGTEHTDAIRIASADIDDNSWHHIELGSPAGGPLYIEVAAPEAASDHPWYVWGSVESPSTDLQRIEAGEPVPGALTYRALRAPDWAEVVYEGDDAVIYEVPSALPLAWGVPTGEVSPDRDEALQRIVDDDFDPRATVVFADEDIDGEPLTGQSVDATVTDSDPDEIRIDVDANGGGYVMLSQRYDDGWQATLNGNSVDILRADNDLQAIPVTDGTHDIRLTFEPDDYEWGQRISIAAAVLTVLGVLGYVAWGRYKRHRVSGVDDDRDAVGT